MAKAFPSAQGAGKNVTGGRAGSLYVVTNLNDSGAGSLRDAVSVGNRFIIFRVDGHINLQTTLLVAQDNITVAGHSATGGGISIGIDNALGANNRDLGAIQIDANNIIFRHIRVRHSLTYPGGSSADGFAIFGGIGIIIDHCSVTWGGDEQISITHYTDETSKASIEDVTIQNCIIGAGYTGSSKGTLITGNVNNVTYYKNFMTMNNIRSPQIAMDYSFFSGERFFEVINNVIYGYKTAMSFYNIQNTGAYRTNVIKNYAKWAPGQNPYRLCTVYESDALAISPQQAFSIYPLDNIDPRRPNNTLAQNESTQGLDGIGNVNVLGTPPKVVSTPFSTPIVNDGIAILDAVNVWADIKDDVGATFPVRDSFDTTLINDYDNTVLRDGAYVTNILPVLNAGSYTADGNSDGIDDTWFTANVPSGSSAMTLAPNGYTYLELYLNRNDGTPAPVINVPVITLVGASTINLNVGQSYTELGATATDVEDGDLTSSIVVDASNVNTNVANTYYVSYNVTDSDTNTATQVLRTVIVSSAVDTTLPVITMIGGNVTINIGETYTDQGATATDNIDGVITEDIVVFSNVNTNVVGSYIVTYNVQDAAGNNATQITRTVTVQNISPGIIRRLSRVKLKILF